MPTNAANLSARTYWYLLPEVLQSETQIVGAPAVHHGMPPQGFPHRLLQSPALGPVAIGGHGQIGQPLLQSVALQIIPDNSFPRH